jgi:hypothetical protein
MTAKDIHISFNFTVSADETIKLLIQIRENHPFHESGKVAITPQRRTARDRVKVETFKQVRIVTLKNVLSLLSQHYDNRVFSYSEALSLTGGQGVSRSILGYAITYGCLHHQLFRVGHGNYSFIDTPKYQADSNSIIDVVAKDSDGLASAIKLMSKVSSTVSLYFSDQAITARFRNHDSSAMIDIRIRSYAFDVMHVKGHVKLTVSCKQLAAILSKKRKSGPVHLQLVNQKDATYKAGFLGDEHSLPVLACETSDKAYGVEQPLDLAPQESVASIELPRALLKDILANVRAHCAEILITCKKDGIASLEPFEAAGYRKELVDNGRDIKINSSSNGARGCFPLSTIMPLVDMQATSKDDSVRLLVSKDALVIQLMRGKDFQVDYYIAPCKMQEEVKHAAFAVTKNDVEALAEQISRLETSMGVNKTEKT